MTSAALVVAEIDGLPEGEVEIEAWLDRHGAPSLEQLTKVFGADAPGQIARTHQRLTQDGGLEIEFQGEEEGTTLWRRRLCYLPDSHETKAMHIFIPTDIQERGIGRHLMRNTVRTSLLFRSPRGKATIHKLTAQTQTAGSYFAARCGFVPRAQSWKRLVPQLLQQTDLVKRAYRIDVSLIRRALSCDDPNMIRQVAAATGFVRENKGDTLLSERRLPLGRVLLARPGISWRGILNLADPGTRKVFVGYVRY